MSGQITRCDDVLVFKIAISLRIVFLGSIILHLAEWDFLSSSFVLLDTDVGIKATEHLFESSLFARLLMGLCPFFLGYLGVQLRLCGYLIIGSSLRNDCLLLFIKLA